MSDQNAQLFLLTKKADKTGNFVSLFYYANLGRAFTSPLSITSLGQDL